MLEKIDLSVKVEKAVYKKAMAEMEEKLGVLQRSCKEAGIPVMILFDGMGAAGKGTQINRLIQVMDPRGFSVYASNRPTEEEQYRPFLWSYWTKTPAKGRIAIFDRSWYRRVQVDRFEGLTADQELPHAFQDIASFEKQLSDGGTVIIKLFLHISKEEQKKRFKKLAASKETAWRVSDSDWIRNKEYERYLRINEEMLEQTDTEYAPWTIIEATDKNYAAMKIMSTVTSRLEYELEKKKEEKTAEKGQKKKTAPSDKYKNGVLSGVDLSKDRKSVV